MDAGNISILVVFVLLVLMVVVGYFRRKSQAPAPGTPSSPRSLGQLQAADPNVALNAMKKSIRSWAIWSILIGVTSLVGSEVLNASWGILMISVGLMSFYFVDPAMFPLYGVTMGWAALSNLLAGVSGSGTWGIFALLQIWWSYRIFREFFIFRRAQAQAASAPPPATADQPAATGEAPAEEPLFASQTQPPPSTGIPGEPGYDPFAPPRARSRAERVFPWAGAALGVLALAGSCGLLGASFIRTSLPAAVEGYGYPTMINLAVLGLGFSLASILSRHQPLGPVISGLFTNGATMLMWLTIMLMGTFLG